MSVWVLKVGLVGSMVLALACGDDGAPAGEVDAGPAGTIDADTTPRIDAAPPLMGVEAYCAPGGAFEELLASRSSCRLQPIRGLMVGTDLREGDAHSQFCEELFAPLLADPTVSFDDSKIQACLDHLSATPCAELPNDPQNTPCTEVFIGTLGSGEDCDHSMQCAGDAYCGPASGSCGQCVDRLALGVACTSDGQCSDGACNALGVCAVPVALGGACTDTEDCAGILECDGQSSLCVDGSPKVGDLCDDHTDCTLNAQGFGMGLYCHPGNGQNTCEALPKIGETCGPMGPRGQPLCDFRDYVWCNPDNNTCAAPSTSALGGSCNAFAVVGAGARQCEAGDLCTNAFVDAGEVGTCIAAGYEGDICTMDEPVSGCYPGYTCAGSLCEAPELISGLCPAPAP